MWLYKHHSQTILYLARTALGSRNRLDLNFYSGWRGQYFSRLGRLCALATIIHFDPLPSLLFRPFFRARNFHSTSINQDLHTVVLRMYILIRARTSSRRGGPIPAIEQSSLAQFENQADWACTTTTLQPAPNACFEAYVKACERIGFSQLKKKIVVRRSTQPFDDGQISNIEYINSFLYSFSFDVKDDFLNDEEIPSYKIERSQTNEYLDFL